MLSRRSICPRSKIGRASIATSDVDRGTLVVRLAAWIVERLPSPTAAWAITVPVLWKSRDGPRNAPASSTLPLAARSAIIEGPGRDRPPRWPSENRMLAEDVTYAFTAKFPVEILSENRKSFLLFPDYLVAFPCKTTTRACNTVIAAFEHGHHDVFAIHAQGTFLEERSKNF